MIKESVIHSRILFEPNILPTGATTQQGQSENAPQMGLLRESLHATLLTVIDVNASYSKICTKLQTARWTPASAGT